MSPPRNVKKRKLSLEDRGAIPDELAEFNSADSIPPSFYQFATDCVTRFPLLSISNLPEKVMLFDITKDVPPSIVFSVIVYPSFKVEAFHGSSQISIKDVIGFPYTLYRWSQLEEVINRSRNFVLPEEKESFNADFLTEQIQLSSCNSHHRRYSSLVTHVAVQVYLTSRSAFRVLSPYLAFPSSVTLKKHLGKFSSVGGEDECRETVSTVFSKLNDGQKKCFILFDEVYVKPSIRYRGGHLIGYAVDKPNEPARTLLAIMLKPMFGSPAFVTRLIPINSLSPSLLTQQLKMVISCVIENGGNVIGMLSDNHPTNRSSYELFRFDPQTPFLGKSDNQPGQIMYLLQDPVHLFKSIRNNWFTEKSRRLKVVVDGIEYEGNWNDIIRLYEGEKSSALRRTNLSYEAVYPSPIDRQKVTLMVQVFNEKTVAALRTDGSNATADFLHLLVKCWSILNIKDKFGHIKLLNPDRKPFYSDSDERLTFLTSLASGFSLMAGGKGLKRHLSLTSETRNAVTSTLQGFASLIPYLLSKDHSYVLPGQFQTDRLEAEFGMYRLINYIQSPEW